MSLRQHQKRISLPLKRFFIFSLLVGCAVVNVCWAADRFIHIQGRLTDNKGIPIEGNPKIKLEIFQTAEGGGAAWTEGGYSAVQTNSAGLFAKDIGPLPDTVFSGGTDLFLQITIEGIASDQILKPRQKMTTVPFAFWSEVSGTANIANDIKDNTVTAAKLTNDSVEFRHLTIGSVKSANIFDGTIISTDLAPNSVTSAIIENGTITNEDIQLNAVNGASVQDRSLAGTDIAEGSITSFELANASVGAEEIAGASVDATRLAPGAVTNAHLAGGVILRGNILDNQVSVEKVDLGTFHANNLYWVPREFLFIAVGPCPPGFKVYANSRRRFIVGAATLVPPASNIETPGKRLKAKVELEDVVDDNDLGVLVVNFCQRE